MIPGEQFYASLKRLTEMSEWEDYEAFLDKRMEGHFQNFLSGDDKLEACHFRSQEIQWVKVSVKQLIEEVEQSRKPK